MYLGWQHAPGHPDPGPPPKRPVPPAPEQLSTGWLAAQRREQDRLGRPLKLAAAGCLVLLAGVILLARAGLVSGPLAAVLAAVLAALAALSARGTWRGERALRAAVSAEKQRVAAARTAQQRRLAAWQDEHARRFRDWQERDRAFAGQAHWYPVWVPDDIDRVDVAGGTLPGWSAVLTMLAAPRLAAGGEVTVLDLSEGAAAADLLAVARGSGIEPLVWVMPDDLPRLDLGAGLPRHALADVLALTAAAPSGPDSPPDPAQDAAILERVLTVLGDGAAVGQVMAALRALGEVGDPRDDVRRGLLTAGQLDGIRTLYGSGAAGRVVTERAWALEARLHALAPLGSALAPLPASPLRVVALDRKAGMASTAVLSAYLAVALTHLLRQAPAGKPWQHTLCLAGAERLRGDVLDRLCDACEATRTGLVLAYRTLPRHATQRLGRGNAAVMFMRTGNAGDAKAASEQIGMAHRFVLAQLTETIGTSVTGTVGDSYTSSVADADSAGYSAGTSETTSRSRGRGHSSTGLAPFSPRTGSGSRDLGRSQGTTDSESVTRGITVSTSWGVSTSRAIGANESLARSVQRSREFLVEPHELQQLPPTAAIVSYAGRSGRQLVMADVNPGILALPTATLADPAEAAYADPGPAGAGHAPGASSREAGPRPSPDRGPSPQPGAWPPPGSPREPGVSREPGASRVGQPSQTGQARDPGQPPQTGQPQDAGQPPQARQARDPGQPPQTGRAQDPGRPEPDPPVAPSPATEPSPPPNLGPPPEPLDWRTRRP
ncbi:MAG: hypothetical protein LBI49_10180 [Nocardiopsaceae bacterium]|nr:hypothetical protein [Nocardiopsaceae bacterium]